VGGSFVAFFLFGRGVGSQPIDDTNVCLGVKPFSTNEIYLCGYANPRGVTVNELPVNGESSHGMWQDQGGEWEVAES
jgi:hypothetical protein